MRASMPVREGSGRAVAVSMLAAALIIAVGTFALWLLLFPAPSSVWTPNADRKKILESFFDKPRQLAAGRFLTVWWDALPPALRELPRGAEASNIHPADYTGPESCRDCHAQNYERWSQHPHRWMNARAEPAAIKGDFSGQASIDYRGGRATFLKEGAEHRMRLERGDVRRVYTITQTIGSRFFQYYVGKQIEGPEPPGHHFTTEEHVLPFGYWLDEREWVPVVHIGPEVPDDKRADPFAPPESGQYYAEYASSCNYCHTTFPLGDLLGRRTQQLGEYAPARLHWAMRPYLEQAHPGKLAEAAAAAKEDNALNPLLRWDAPQHAVTYGVSCEACHLGAKEHVLSKGEVLPRFFPASPHLTVETKEPIDAGRTHANINWACGRCHIGERPRYAAGMSTWNSVEYTDAMLGGCYTQMTCVHCHNPHQTIGKKWSLSADQDDRLCIQCHDKFGKPEARRQHTHHAPGSDGDRCMNCHMPRLNEGIQDVVRTHMIFAPTRADMIEANHPNACNLCHTDQPIDWTLERLRSWYGKSYDEAKIAAAYPRRAASAARHWAASGDPAVRLSAVAALTERRDRAALPEVLGALDDPYLVNRQFAGRGLEQMLGIKLRDFGYRFYMTQDERRGPLQGLRAKLGL